MTRSDEDILSGLKQAAEVLGQPLSRMAYRKVAPGLGIAADMTVVKRFGSFPEALKRAGLRGFPSVGRRNGSLTREDALAAVVRCVEAHNGEWVAYRSYCAWVADNDAPSGPSIRVFWTWNDVMTEALAQYEKRVL